MSKSKIIIFFLIIAAAALFSFQDLLARLMWQKYSNANAAYFLNRRDADLAIQLGNYYFGNIAGKSEYNLDRAEKAYKKALRMKPEILWGHYQLARIYFINKDFNKALSEISKELELNPGNVRSFYVRGLIFAYRGDLAGAENDFKEFIRWLPKEWAGYNDLAWVLSKREKYAEAEKILKSAADEVDNASENPWLLNSLGAVLLNLKKYPAAAASFEKALELSEKLTVHDWRRAYPGNDPASAEGGLSAFITAIKKNLSRAREGVDNVR